MKTNWQTKKLGEVCYVSIGKTPARGDKKFWDKEKKTDNIWLSIRDLNNTNGKEVFDSREYISDKGAKLFKAIKKGTLLVSFKLTLGRLAFAGVDLRTNEAIASLEIKNEKEISKYFLYYFLNFFDWDKATEGEIKVKGRTLNKSKLKQIKIPIPALPEQKRIVGILDGVFGDVKKTKENAEKNLANAKEFFESYLQSVFENPGKDWEERKLGEVCDTGAGGTPLKAHKDYYENGNIPWLRSGEVCQKDIIKSELFITEKGLKKSSARMFHKNTVLVAMYGATAGQTGILKFESTTNQAVCGILPNSNFLPEYIYYFFSAKKNDLVKQAVGGAQPNISQIKIKNTFIPILSLKTQKQIVKKLDELSAQTKKLEVVYQQKIDDLEELKKSVLKKAFNGDL